MKKPSPKGAINWKDIAQSTLMVAGTAALGVAGQMVQHYLADGSSFYMDNATIVLILKNSGYAGCTAGLFYIMKKFGQGPNKEE